jgi:hypothetical protein
MDSTSTGTVRYGLLGLVPDPRTAAGILGGLCYPLLYGCTVPYARSSTDAAAAAACAHTTVETTRAEPTHRARRTVPS